MFTDHLKEIADGVFENPEAQEPKGTHMKDHYTENAKKILEADKYHYECMARVFSESPVFAKEFYSVADIAGGHPKLASKMKIAGTITVYDQYAATYKKTHKDFLELYPTEAEVVYEKKSITHPNFTPNAELAICCHVLEHLTLEQIERLLGNLETDKIVIYGPNIGRARNRSWWHFGALDHKTFATLEAMCRLVSNAGFTVKQADPYHEDYLIYGDK